MIDRLGLLERFRAVVEHGSVRRAAAAMNISQPALSRSIRMLEDDFGTPLFTREARGLVLTSFGTRVLAVASRLARDWEMARATLLDGSGDFHGVMRMSAGPVWAAVVLPALLPRLQERFPRLCLEILSPTATTFSERLRSGQVDVCLGVHADPRPNLGEIETTELWAFRDRVLARTRHPIHACDPGDLDALHRYPWLVYTAMPTYPVETKHLVSEHTGRMPEIVMSTDSLALLLRLLNGGDYLCFLPEGFEHIAPAGTLRTVPMAIGRGVFRTGATYRRTYADFEPLQAFLGLCREYFRGWPSTEAR